MIDFQKKKFRELARQLNTTEAELLEIFHKVCRLEPHPGRSISAEAVHYIAPDVFVKLIDGELMIYLNEGSTGRLSVDRFYRRLLRQQARAMTPQEKEYAREKFQAAITLIKNIEKRKSTIMRVTEAIMEVQREFLDKGVEALKPLTLREVADMVGMHESTVARVTSRKYVETPQGTYALKFFFSSSIDTTDNSDAVSSRSIKDKLQTIIGAEDAKKPLSDQKIAEMLKKQGFDIARRTVAKYREQLKILPAKYRRQT
jgi:RNA polymerase sigma-54 factor